VPVIGYVTVSSSVVIGGGCSITCHVNCSAETDFLCGSPTGTVELTFHADALREFLRLGAEALRVMDSRLARDRIQLEQTG
jgi:hypothetical protein